MLSIIPVGYASIVQVYNREFGNARGKGTFTFLLNKILKKKLGQDGDDSDEEDGDDEENQAFNL